MATHTRAKGVHMNRSTHPWRLFTRFSLPCIALLSILIPGICGATGSDAASTLTVRSSAVRLADVAPMQLHVVGNDIVDGAGQVIVLHGVNRSGTEYQCTQSPFIFDGPSDAASVQAIAAWHTNAVRVPLNEDCWLGINGEPSGGTTAAQYQQAIVTYVQTLQQNGLIPILDLAGIAPGTEIANQGVLPMPDADHSPAFWASVASTFKTNAGVMFDLYNEPWPDNNTSTTAAWTCWKTGGTCPGVPYQAAGMQQLVDTVRAAGANNVLMLGGIGFAGDLRQFGAYKPTDPQGNIVASWHLYDFGGCTGPSCWDPNVAGVGNTPIVVGEMGETDCNHTTFIDPLMAFLDSKNIGYLGWAWDTFSCSGFPSLITSYDGTPTNYGIGLRDHLAAIAGQPPIITTPTPELGSGELVATGLLPFGILLYRRRRTHRKAMDARAM